MKKILNLFCLFLLVFGISMSVEAKDDLQKVGEGYTSEGIYYEVFAVDDGDVSLCATSVSVTRLVTYKGIVTPQLQIPWQEEIGGIYYSGTLNLISFSYEAGETVATYKGTLYAE